MDSVVTIRADLNTGEHAVTLPQDAPLELFRRVAAVGRRIYEVAQGDVQDD